MITRSAKLIALLLPTLLGGCATYESQPLYSGTVESYPYSSPQYYPAPPAYYVTPAPVYVGPPVYVNPVPSFGLQIQSAPHFGRAHDAPRQGTRHGRGRRGDDNERGTGENSRMGGPGESGTVWKR